MANYCDKCGTSHECSVCPRCQGFGVPSAKVKHKHTPEAMRAMAELVAYPSLSPNDIRNRAAAMLRDIADAMEATNYPEIPEGWKLVPVEPTNEMCIEAQRRVAYMTVNTPYGKLCRDQYAHAWIAMLAAAPSPTDDGRNNSMKR